MLALAQNTFHGNVARTGVFQGSAPAKAPAIQWSFKTGGPIVGSAAVANGVVYIASLSSYLYAVDQQSGEKKWEFKSRMPIASSPTIADGLVYFVSSTGALAAIDAATGQPAWVFPGEFEKKFEAKGLHGYPNAGQVIPDAWDFYTSSPAVANGKVYFRHGRWQRLRRGREERHPAMEVHDRRRRPCLALGRRQHGIHRQLRRELRAGRRHRRAEMGVRGRP
jgi:hypothetical protein